MNQKFLGWLFALAIMLFVMASIVRGDFMMAGASVMLFFMAPIARRPNVWWMLAVATIGCEITPGIYGGADLHVLLAAVFVAITIITQSISKSHQASLPSLTRKACIALILVIVFTATMRGWGFKMFGSNRWGGMQYVSLIATLLFYINSTHVTISYIQLRRMLRWFFLLALLPVVALSITWLLPSATWISKIINISSAPGELLERASEVTRLPKMEYPAVWLGVFALFLYDRHAKVTPMVILSSALSFLMIGLSGYRMIALLLGATLLVYMTIRQRTASFRQFLKIAVLPILFLAGIYRFWGDIPYTFQRPFAWLPGIEISREMEKDTVGTLEWRIEMWGKVLGMVPDYLWLGKGLAFNMDDVNAAMALASDRETRHIAFIAGHSYHVGSLLVVMDLGLAGLAAWMVFTLGGIVRYGRALRRIPKGSRWSPAYVVFYSLFASYCVFFLIAFGDLKYMCHIPVLASFLEVILRSSEADETIRQSRSEIGERTSADDVA